MDAGHQDPLISQHVWEILHEKIVPVRVFHTHALGLSGFEIPVESYHTFLDLKFFEPKMTYQDLLAVMHAGSAGQAARWHGQLLAAIIRKSTAKELGDFVVRLEADYLPQKEFSEVLKSRSSRLALGFLGRESQCSLLLPGLVPLEKAVFPLLFDLTNIGYGLMLDNIASTKSAFYPFSQTGRQQLAWLVRKKVTVRSVMLDRALSEQLACTKACYVGEQTPLQRTQAVLEGMERIGLNPQILVLHAPKESSFNWNMAANTLARWWKERKPDCDREVQVRGPEAMTLVI